jgi:diacylglycerol kinase family enzyme
MVKTIESGYDLIVTVSGDGLAHEVINGLMMRDDWETFKE